MTKITIFPLYLYIYKLHYPNIYFQNQHTGINKIVWKIVLISYNRVQTIKLLILKKDDTAININENCK